MRRGTALHQHQLGRQTVDAAPSQLKFAYLTMRAGHMLATEPLFAIKSGYISIRIVIIKSIIFRISLSLFYCSFPALF
jgi:hypothetical protein